MLRYCLGKENANADGLSRQYLQAEGPGVLQTVQPVKATLSTGLGGNHTISGNTIVVLSSFPVYRGGDRNPLGQNVCRRIGKQWNSHGSGIKSQRRPGWCIGSSCIQDGGA